MVMQTFPSFLLLSFGSVQITQDTRAGLAGRCRAVDSHEVAKRAFACAGSLGKATRQKLTQASAGGLVEDAGQVAGFGSRQPVRRARKGLQDGVALPAASWLCPARCCL
jgi:hypothetical protein